MLYSIACNKGISSETCTGLVRIVRASIVRAEFIAFLPDTLSDYFLLFLVALAFNGRFSNDIHI